MSTLSLGVSRRLQALKSLFVLGVVLVHAGKVPMCYTDGDYALTSRLWFALFGQNTMLIVVPFFFTISGFLHFRSYTQSWENYVALVKKKTRTLLLPYLLLNATAVVMVLVFRKIPYISDIYGLEQRGWLNALLGLDNFPILYPLWFLRDLYLLFLATPIFIWLGNRIGALLLLIPWTLLFVYTDQSFFVSLRGIIFFGMGLYFARNPQWLEKRFNCTWLFALYVVLTLAETARLYFSAQAAPLGPLNMAATCIIMPVIWQWASRYDDHPEAYAVRFSGLAFFVYLLHEPVLSYFIYLSRFIVRPAGPVLEPLGLIVLACLTIVSLGCLGYLMERFTPGLYALLTGGRGPTWQRRLGGRQAEQLS